MGIENRGGNTTLTNRELERAKYMKPDEIFYGNFVTSSEDYPYGIYRGRTVDKVIDDLEKSGNYSSIRRIPATGKKPGRVIHYMTGVVVIRRTDGGGTTPSVTPMQPLSGRLVLAA